MLAKRGPYQQLAWSLRTMPANAQQWLPYAGRSQLATPGLCSAFAALGYVPADVRWAVSYLVQSSVSGWFENLSVTIFLVQGNLSMYGRGMHRKTTKQQRTPSLFENVICLTKVLLTFQSHP